jgi:hypothetical protein
VGPSLRHILSPPGKDAEPPGSGGVRKRQENTGKSRFDVTTRHGDELHSCIAEISVIDPSPPPLPPPSTLVRFAVKVMRDESCSLLMLCIFDEAKSTPPMPKKSRSRLPLYVYFSGAVAS